MLHIEVSAKQGTNVENSFMKLVQEVYTKIEKGEIDPRLESSGVRMNSDKMPTVKPGDAIKLNAEPKTNSGSGCSC